MQDGQFATGWGVLRHGSSQSSSLRSYAHGQASATGAYGMSSYGCHYWMVSPTYCMMGYAAGHPGYGYNSLCDASAAKMSAFAPRPTTAGMKGDYKNLLEEMKAKQAMRDKHKSLCERIAECDAHGSHGKEKERLQQRLTSLEHELWLLGESNCDTSFGGSCSSASVLGPPDDGRADQFSRLCHALAEFLRLCERHESLLSTLESERKVQQEWRDLTRSRIVTHSTKLKHLLLARPGLFEVKEVVSGQLTVRLVGESDSLEKAPSGEVPISTGKTASTASPGGAASQELRGLERLLQQLTTARDLVGEAMVFCIDNGMRHAAPLAKALVKALQEPNMETEVVLARLFLVSDILYNSNACARGAARYQSSFQDLLPDASERLGRQWFQRLEQGRLEQARAERAVRCVLGAWQEWAVFPPLFCRGLQALLFAPVPEVPLLGSLGNNEALRRKLEHWHSSGEAARLPYAARLRGLSGPGLPVAECRARLCHYELYWHNSGSKVPHNACSMQKVTAKLDLIMGHTMTDSVDEALDVASVDADSIDGDPLSDFDVEVASTEGEDLNGQPVSHALLHNGTDVPKAKRQRTGSKVEAS
mmetsp:Transcript_35080/g.81462  ORF Transcript_35080/g.81462 Transcript_35080/m.81462 type:complete len:591 (+) Transcript_35080:320-2092(+)